MQTAKIFGHNEALPFLSPTLHNYLGIPDPNQHKLMHVRRKHYVKNLISLLFLAFAIM